MELANLLKSNDSLCTDEKITADNGDVIISCNQSGIAATENPLVQFEALHNIEVENVLASEDLQNALALLDRKRQELVMCFNLSRRWTSLIFDNNIISGLCENSNTFDTHKDLKTQMCMS